MKEARVSKRTRGRRGEEHERRGEERDASENGGRGGLARQSGKIHGMQLLSFMA